MPKPLPAGLTQYVLNNFSKKSLRTTSLETTFWLPSNDSKWRRSPATSRSGGEVESSRCYTRRIGRGSPNHHGSEKWTSNSLAPTFCVIGPALQTSTAKPTAFTAGCALARHSVSFPGITANVFGVRLRFATTTTRCSPRETTFGTRATMGYGGLKNQREYDGGWSILGPIFGRPGADQASYPSGALHGLNAGRMRFLMPPGPRSQRVPSADPT